MTPARGVVAVVPSAGTGRRLGQKIKKPFVPLGSKPLITYALQTLEECKAIDAVIIAAERRRIKAFRQMVKEFKFKKVISIVPGGKTRFESVRNCVKKIGPSFGIVLIHDGARPFVDKKTIERAVKLAGIHGGCVTAVPEIDTVKVADSSGFVKETLDRRMIYRAQTPQAFRRDLIKRAYRESSGTDITDDAGLVERMGGVVRILPGSYRNIKITTKEDLKMAEVLLCDWE